MILRITIFLISSYFSDACVRTIPPEEVFITSTPDSIPGDPCATCPEIDLSNAELKPPGNMISKEEAITPDGCKQTTVRCNFTPSPGMFALSSSLNGIMADGTAPHIGEFPSPGIGKDYSILTCHDNATYVTSRGV
ncbi:hypothetical protein B9Z55_008718 [Caenorhabditis nigoni]|nr:hypothetical protein B9Z55_008718 [Caenorhabditis nigoni]